MRRLDSTIGWLLRHWYLAVALLLCIPLYWSSDREPPMRVLAHIEPAPTRPGEAAVFVLPVQRQLERGCSVELTRYLVDSSGTKYSLSHEELPVDALRRIQAAMGPFLRVAVTVPVGAAAGKATVNTEYQYACNPLHQLLSPIRISQAWPLTILEPQP